MPPDKPLGRAATQGVLWQALAFVSGKLLLLVATVVLARVLTPTEFGLVTLALVFIGFVEVVADFGISQALIYLGPEPRRVDTALVCTLIFGTVLGLLIAVSAPLVAGLLGNPASEPLLRVLSLALLLRASGMVPDTLLRQALNFRRRVVVQVALSATRGISAVILALAGFGVWSLVVAELLGQLVYSLVAWNRVSYRPSPRSLRVHRGFVRPLFSYGLPAAGNGLLNTAVINADYVIVGRLLGAGALGYYTLAFRVPEMIIIGTFQIVSTVAFPVYSRARHEPARLVRGYVRVVRLVSAYGLVTGALLAVLAPLVVDVVFGARWHASAPALQALALYAALRSLGAGAVDLLKAVGRPHIALLLAATKLVVLIPVLAIAAGSGILAVAWAQMGMALVFTAVTQLVVARALDVSVWVVTRPYLPSLAAAAIAAGATTWLVHSLSVAPLGQLLLAAGGGAACGIATLLSIKVTRGDLLGLVRSRRAS